MNYWYNMQPYYDIENINTYPSDTQQKNTIEEKHMKGILERCVATGRKVNGQCIQDMFVKSCLIRCKVVFICVTTDVLNFWVICLISFSAVLVKQLHR